MSFSFDKLPVDKFLQKNLSFNEGNVLSAIRGGGVLGLINSVLAPSFGIYYASGKDQGKQPFTPDSFVVVEVGAEASVSTAPVEQGAYTTFNKIQRPPELHVTFTVEGWTAFSGAIPNLTNFSTTSRSNVLEILEKMRTTAGLYDIETPDKTWTSCDLVKYDYRTRSNNGPTLLTVTAVFQTIQKTGEVSVGSTDKKAPTDNDKAKGEAAVKTQQVTASVTQLSDADRRSVTNRGIT
ncbi:TPA: phage baseplate protein [Salmonella enterica subsp. diarizonae serovar 61:r:-]